MSYKYIWYKHIPRHISVFMWKLWQSKLPLDEGLLQKGFSLASKCVCCIDNGMETFSHVFLTSPIALQVWISLSMDCGIKTTQSTLQQACFSWWLQGSNSSPHLYIIPSLIMWELWKERKNILFEGKHNTAIDITRGIKREM